MASLRIAVAFFKHPRIASNWIGLSKYTAVSSLPLKLPGFMPAVHSLNEVDLLLQKISLVTYFAVAVDVCANKHAFQRVTQLFKSTDRLNITFCHEIVKAITWRLAELYYRHLHHPENLGN